jgi:hypothetical protein
VRLRLLGQLEVILELANPLYFVSMNSHDVRTPESRARTPAGRDPLSLQRVTITADGVGKYVFGDNSVLVLRDSCGYVTHVDNGARHLYCASVGS